MIEYLKYQTKLTKLFRQKESIRNAYTDDICKVRKEGKPREDIQSLEHQPHFEESMIDEDISIFVTDGLVYKARRRFIPVPVRETEGMWEQCDTISNRYILTSRGISELRSSLRKERKEQVELVVMLLAILTGLIGAVTGFVAVIMR